MTAEIAILNRTAVTLAADSAVTLTVGGRRKIYQSADKIFDLSLLNAVALMAYNSLEYHEIPFEVLIKSFRNSEHCRDCATLFDCADSFLRFLTECVPVPTKLVDRHVRQLVKDEYASINERYSHFAFEHLTSKSIKKKLNPRSLFFHILRHRLDELEAQKPSSCFADVDHNFIIEAHHQALDDAVKEASERIWPEMMN